MAIRFRESDARPMGRNTSGVKGYLARQRRLPRRHGRRRPRSHAADRLPKRLRQTHPLRPQRRCPRKANRQLQREHGELASASRESSEPAKPPKTKASSSFRYRTQNRGGKGLRDIKTTERNGPVIGIVRVDETDELMMMTARGKIQRVAVSDFNAIGRNTQGVRIMSLDEEDALAAIVRVPKEESDDGRRRSHRHRRTPQLIADKTSPI